MRFTKPVAIDDTITFTGKVVEVDGGRLKAEISAKNQKGDDVLKGAVVEARV